MKQLIFVTQMMIAVCLVGMKTEAQSGHLFVLRGLDAQTVPVTLNKITNLVFPVKIRTAVKVSRDIAVQRVKGVENVLELKALRANVSPTNLSVYGMDGELYSFDLQYAAEAPVLNFVVENRNGSVISSGGEVNSKVLLKGLPLDLASLQHDAETIGSMGGFLNEGGANHKLRWRLKGIYLKDSLMWFSFLLSNHSQIDYSPRAIRFSIRDRKTIKRTAVQEIELGPVYDPPMPVIPGDSARMVVIGLRPFIISKSKVLVLRVNETGQGGGLFMRVSSKKILKARKIQ